MESEGPYFIDKDGYITGPTGKHDFVTLDTLKVFNSVFECGKSEGRKAAEKDFKEAIGWADSICLDWNYSKDYKKWKKARGIE